MLRENREKIAEADVKKAEEASKTPKKAINEGGVLGCGAADGKRRALAAQESPKSFTRRRQRRTGWCGGGRRAGGVPPPAQARTGEEPGDVIGAEYVDVDETKRPN